MSPCCVADRDFDINSSVTDSENSSMHECVRETPLRFPIALLYLRALLWRSIDSIGGLSRLSTNHGVWVIENVLDKSVRSIHLRWIVSGWPVRTKPAGKVDYNRRNEKF